jgi:DNA-binding transcriptional MerR regulator
MPQSLAEAPDLLTIDQAASATGLSLWTIRKYETNDPTFPKRTSSTFSRTRRFRKAELVRWVAGPAS